MVRVRTRPDHPATGAALAVVGGMLDAYTYVAHGGVFANAQTGNVVLIAVSLAQHDTARALRYLPIIAAFLVGLLTAEVLAAHRSRRFLGDPTRVVLGAEILVLALVAAAPTSTPHAVSTIAVAFVAALQVTTFRLVRDTAYSTTMTTGNMRTFVTALYEWLSGRAPGQRAAAGRLAVVMLSFAGGAVLGAVLSAPDALGTHACAIAAVILVGVLAAVEAQTRRIARAGVARLGAEHAPRPVGVS